MCLIANVNINLYVDYRHVVHHSFDQRLRDLRSSQEHFGQLYS
jgi:hypothetical protein